jgi:hypothetical protein
MWGISGLHYLDSSNQSRSDCSSLEAYANGSSENLLTPLEKKVNRRADDEANPAQYHSASSHIFLSHIGFTVSFTIRQTRGAGHPLVLRHSPTAAFMQLLLPFQLRPLGPTDGVRSLSPISPAVLFF